MSLFGKSEEGPRKKFKVLLQSGRNITDPTTKRSTKGATAYDLICILELGGQKYKTEVFPKSMAPSWQSTYEFDITDLPPSSVLTITCEAYGTVWNSYLGETRIPLSGHVDVSFEYATPHWFPLTNDKLSKRDGHPGEVCVKIGNASDGLKPQRAYTDTDNASLADRDVEDIYAEANVFAQEGNDSAHRSLNILYQTREIGGSTMGRLREQGSQIERMQTDMDQVHSNMQQSERKLRSIESVWGTFANMATSNRTKTTRKGAQASKVAASERKKQHKERQQMKDKEWKQKKKDGSARTPQNRRRDVMIQTTPGSRRNQGVEEQEFYQRVDDTDRTLDSMGSVLDDLKEMALDMNGELDVQNKRLDILQRDITQAQPRIDRAIGRCSAIVKN